MTATFLLAQRYLAHHRARTILLVLAVALTALLPIAVNVLVSRFSAELMARARAMSRGGTGVRWVSISIGSGKTPRRKLG